MSTTVYFSYPSVRQETGEVVQLSAPEQLLSAAMMRFNVARRKSPRQEKAGNTQASSLSLSLPFGGLSYNSHTLSLCPIYSYPPGLFRLSFVCSILPVDVPVFSYLRFHQSRPPPVTTNPHQFEPSDLLPLMGSERNTAVLLSR